MDSPTFRPSGPIRRNAIAWPHGRAARGVRRDGPAQLRPVPRTPSLPPLRGRPGRPAPGGRAGTRVLEVACGPGIVTGRLVRRLAGQGTLVATDLDDAMIAHARTRVPADPALEWRQADRDEPPLPRPRLRRGGLRVRARRSSRTRPRACGCRSGSSSRAGTYLFNVWDKIEHNAVARISHDHPRVLPRRSAPVLPGSVQSPGHGGGAGPARCRGLRGRGVAVRREGRAEPVGRGCGHRARRGEPRARHHHGAPDRKRCPTSRRPWRGTSPRIWATTRCGPPSGRTCSRCAARASVPTQKSS